MTERPHESEFAEFYRHYVSLVPEVDVVPVLDRQAGDLQRVVAAVPSSQERFRYEPGKWSIREVIGHLVDAERVFGYRAFSISRGEQKALPGFDENDYVGASSYDRRPLAEIANEFAGVRLANLSVFQRLDEAEWTRVGKANGHPVSVRALAFIMIGHVRHHVGILTSRYGIQGL